MKRLDYLGGLSNHFSEVFKNQQELAYYPLQGVGSGWGIILFPQNNFYLIGFKESKGYEAFLKNVLSSLEKKGKAGDCQEIYQISNECYAGDLYYRRDLEMYMVVIMKSMDFADPKVRFPPPPPPVKKKSGSVLE